MRIAEKKDIEELSNYELYNKKKTGKKNIQKEKIKDFMK